jgi:hypothetical protein
MKFLKSKKYSKIFFLAATILLILAGAYLNETKRLSVNYYTNLIGLNSIKNEFYNYLDHNKISASAFQVIHSNNYVLRLTKLPLASSNPYGGLDEITDNKLLYVDGDGNGLIFDGMVTRSIYLPKLPNHKDEFVKDFSVYSSLFGIKDIYINKVNGNKSLIVTSTNYNAKYECYFLSVFASEIVETEDELHFSDWINLFDSSPCLPKHSKEGFAGKSQGGRIVGGAVDGIFFVSIGDFYFDGVNEKNKTGGESDYGTVVEINSQGSKSVKRVAVGLRNPQGLFMNEDTIYETEHGPQGGDELNVIKLNNKINNYGWPYTTFGVDYGKNDWPLDPFSANHFKSKFVPPIFSWIPSIGISNLVMFKSERFLKRWNRNLIIASLSGQSLFRVILNNGAPIGIEKINIGFRIRDIFQLNDDLYLLEDSQPSAVWKLSQFK